MFEYSRTVYRGVSAMARASEESRLKSSGYCQIYCQIRGLLGIAGDNTWRYFSKLLAHHMSPLGCESLYSPPDFYTNFQMIVRRAPRPVTAAGDPGAFETASGRATLSVACPVHTKDCANGGGTPSDCASALRFLSLDTSALPSHRLICAGRKRPPGHARPVTYLHCIYAVRSPVNF
jgi:hypothetical protein